MKTAVDTNVLSIFLDGTEHARMAQDLLLKAREEGSLFIAPIVYAELIAHPRRDAQIVERLLYEVEIVVDLAADLRVWREAGERFSIHAERRRVSGGGEVRRIVADFIIGAHALHRADRLLTFDSKFFDVNFPSVVQMGRMA